MLATGDSDFLEETTLVSVGDGRYEGTLTNRFNAPVMPQGGVTTAIALVGAEMALDRPDQALCTSYTVFSGQVGPGPVVVETEVMRRGRGASQVRATVRSVDGDAAGHMVVATFATPRETVIGFQATAPAAPPPEECIDRWTTDERPPEFEGPRPSFFEHFDYRHVSGHMPWDDAWDTSSSEVVSWMRWFDTPRNADGAVSPLAIVAPSDTMPPAVFERLGKQDQAFLVPSVDLTVQVFSTELAPGDWLLRRNTSRWAGHGLAAADMEIFSQDGRPLAYATQLMHVRVADRDVVRQRIEATKAEL